MDLTFVLTCTACPEQYDVYLGDTYVAYVRLRWGRLRVDNDSGTTIFSHRFDDPLKGIFDSDSERETFLNIASTHITTYLNATHEHNKRNRLE